MSADIFSRHVLHTEYFSDDMPFVLFGISESCQQFSFFSGEVDAVAGAIHLSGEVRSKLRIAQMAAQNDASFEINVQALQKAQPKDLDASEIDVRLGATWVSPGYIQQFMQETFETPF